MHSEWNGDVRGMGRGARARGVTSVAMVAALLTGGATEPPGPDRIYGEWAVCGGTSNSTVAAGDSGDFCVAGMRVDVGPPQHLAAATAAHDFDGDGSRETIAAELAGLVGSRVVVEVDGVGAGVVLLSIDGRAYRGEVIGSPRGPGTTGSGPCTREDSGLSHAGIPTATAPVIPREE